MGLICLVSEIEYECVNSKSGEPASLWGNKHPGEGDEEPSEIP